MRHKLTIGLERVTRNPISKNGLFVIHECIDQVIRSAKGRPKIATIIEQVIIHRLLVVTLCFVAFIP